MIFIKLILITSIMYVGTVHTAPRKRRLTLAEPMPSYYQTDIDGESGAYSFGYDVWDPETGNTQFRKEERYPNGTVAGSYGYVDPFGKPRRFNYVADSNGYRVKTDRVAEDHSSIVNAHLETTTEPSITWTRGPSKKKTQQNKVNKVFERRKYNNIQPPGFYILY